MPTALDTLFDLRLPALNSRATSTIHCRPTASLWPTSRSCASCGAHRSSSCAAPTSPSVSDHPSGVARQVAPLERMGLVGRESHDRDARLALVVLTETGTRIVDDALQTAETAAERAFAARWSTRTASGSRNCWFAKGLMWNARVAVDGGSDATQRRRRAHRRAVPERSTTAGSNCVPALRSISITADSHVRAFDRGDRS